MIIYYGKWGRDADIDDDSMIIYYGKSGEDVDKDGDAMNCGT